MAAPYILYMVQCLLSTSPRLMVLMREVGCDRIIPTIPGYAAGSPCMAS